MSTAAAAPGPETTPAAAPQRPRDGRFAVVQRVAQGELGSLRVVVGLVVIWAIFTIANDRFLTATNLVNLSLQIAATGMISVGVVLVLLLGEIDLSVAIVSGLCAAIMAVLVEQHGWAAVPGIAAAVAAGAAIGLFQGGVVTRFGIPSFVVTLAGPIGWQGLLLLAIAGSVIAGTSLFGGRGTVWSALLGGLVIGSISNGMDLLALPSSTKYMVTGGVLLAAVVVDAAARQRRQSAGRVWRPSLSPRAA